MQHNNSSCPRRSHNLRSCPARMMHHYHAGLPAVHSATSWSYIAKHRKKQVLSKPASQTTLAGSSTFLSSTQGSRKHVLTQHLARHGGFHRCDTKLALLNPHQPPAPLSTSTPTPPHKPSTPKPLLSSRRLRSSHLGSLGLQQLVEAVPRLSGLRGVGTHGYERLAAVLGHTGLAPVAGVAVQGAHLLQANTAAVAAEAGGEGSVEQHTLVCSHAMTSNHTLWHRVSLPVPPPAPWAPP